jgi:pyruvate-formate lyase-activating enzyme
MTRPPPVGEDEVLYLLGDVAGSPLHGYALVAVRPGPTAEVEFEKDGKRFVVFLARRKAATEAFQETERYRVGYRGDLPDRLGIDLLKDLCARVRANEATAPATAGDAGAPRPGALVVRDGSAELRVTLRCNEKCPFCNTDESAVNVLSSTRDVAAAIDEAAAAGADTVVFTGGEPTLLPDLPAWVVAARLKGLRAWVQTNAVLLSDPAVWDAFRAPDGRWLPPRLFVSFHTARPDRVGRITGVPGTFDRKVAAIKAAKARGVHVELNVVVHDANLDEVPELPAFVAAEVGRDTPIVLSIVAPTGRAAASRDLVPAARDLAPRLAAALDAAADLGMLVRVAEVCGVPMCVLPSHRRGFSAFYRQSPAGPLVPDRVKTLRCAACLFDSHCIGIWRAYVDWHGDGEFQPVLDGEPAGREKDRYLGE